MATPIAVTGVGVVSSLGPNVTTFWDRYLAGRSGLQTIDIVAFSRFRSRVGGQVADISSTDPISRGSRIDKLVFSAAAEALGSAGLLGAQPADLKIGLAFGTCEGSPSAVGSRPPDRLSGTGDRLASLLGLHGPRATFSSACTASAAAIVFAGELLLAGEAEVLVAGGGDALTWQTWAGFDMVNSLDPRPCSPFGRSSGLSLGEGAAFLVLETGVHAECRGVAPIAYLSGWALGADAYHPTAPDPTGRGAAECTRHALQDACMTPEEVGYVNGHGTGTAQNDRMELAAIHSVFSGGEVPLSSTKSAVGHTLGAAGALEAIVAVLALRDGVLPPSLNIDATNPPLLTSGACRVVRTTERVTRLGASLSTNYAFGGNNSALVFTRSPRTRPQPSPTETFITGIGAFGAWGDEDRVWTGTAVGGPGASPITAPRVTRAEPTQRDGLPLTWWRRMDEFSRRCVVVAREALVCAGLERGDRLNDMGLVLATAAGPISTVDRYEAAVLSGAPAHPGLFANSAACAPAGHVMATFGMRGPTTTVTQGALSGVIALMHADLMVRRGHVQRMMVVMADEATDSQLAGIDSEERDGGETRLLGEAAIALVVECDERAGGRGRSTPIRLVDAAIDAVVPHKTLGGLPARMLRRAGHAAMSDVDIIVSFGGSEADDIRSGLEDESSGVSTHEIARDFQGANLGVALLAALGLFEALRKGRDGQADEHLALLHGRGSIHTEGAVIVDVRTAGLFAADGKTRGLMEERG